MSRKHRTEPYYAVQRAECYPSPPQPLSQAITCVLNMVFQFALVVFETLYLDTTQKTRFAYLLWTLQPRISMASWQSALSEGFSNRRQGRFQGALKFNPDDVANNECFNELQHTGKLAGKLSVEETCVRFLPSTMYPLKTCVADRVHQMCALALETFQKGKPADALPADAVPADALPADALPADIPLAVPVNPEALPVDALPPQLPPANPVPATAGSAAAALRHS